MIKRGCSYVPGRIWWIQVGPVMIHQTIGPSLWKILTGYHHFIAHLGPVTIYIDERRIK